MYETLSVLIAEGSDSGLLSLLREMKLSPLVVPTASAAWQFLNGQQPQVVVADLDLPDNEGPVLVSSLINRHPYLTVIVMGKEGELSQLREAIRRGAWDYLLRPLDRRQVQAAMKGAFERVKLVTKQRP